VSRSANVVDKRRDLPSAASPIVLASASAARAALLAAAGLDVEVDPASIEEGHQRRRAPGELAPGPLAMALAERKALAVSRRRATMLVIGADQVLACAERIFAKPKDLAAARADLIKLRGRPHVLYSAVVAARDGTVVWRHVTVARLVMRDFSDDFLDWYLERAGAAVLASVGAYQLEGLGGQLFSAIDGDYFAILGLPLVPLLDFLRTDGAARE